MRVSAGSIVFDPAINTLDFVQEENRLAARSFEWVKRLGPQNLHCSCTGTGRGL